MISDADIDALPADPEEAFVKYEGILRAVVREEKNDPAQEFRREYVAHILAFIDTRNLPIEVPRNPPSGDDGFYDWYLEFVRAVDYFKAAARLRVGDRKRMSFTVIALAPEMKVQIGGHIEAIRKIVGEATLSESKRDALARRIAELQREVDSNRTRPEALTALYLDATIAVAKGAVNLDPLFKRIESMWKIFAKAADDNQQKALTGPQETKRIAAPTTPPEEPSTPRLPGPDLDDEIPF